MIPAGFDYVVPTSVAETVRLLQEYGDEAKIIAGGHSLLPTMKLRLAAPGVLIDIGTIADLRGITVTDRISIGALTTHHMIATSEALHTACPILPECAAVIGDIQVRNRGTLGGSLAHADPAADWPPVMLVLDAQISLIGPNGTRTLNAEDFFVDLLMTALEPEEVLTCVDLPTLGAGEGAAYVKLRHPASRYAVVGVAAYVRFAGGKVTVARIGITGAGVKAERQPTAEALLVGSDGGAEAITATAAQSGSTMEVLGDIHAGEEYRRALINVYTRRALVQAVARAGG